MTDLGVFGGGGGAVKVRRPAPPSYSKFIKETLVFYRRNLFTLGRVEN